MALYLVYNGWMGNGAEGVLVEAVDEDEARWAALAALQEREEHLIETGEANIARYAARRGRGRAVGSSRMVDESRAKIANFQEHWRTWKVEPVTLPWIGEFG